MEINQKAKLVQIIPEEKSKGYGFIKKPNCDYLNLQPLEEVEYYKSKRFKLTRILFIISFLGMIIFVLLSWFLKTPDWIVVIFFLLFVLVGIFGKPGRKEQFYFDQPFAIQKPYYFKVGDIININIQLTKYV